MIKRDRRAFERILTGICGFLVIGCASSVWGQAGEGVVAAPDAPAAQLIQDPGFESSSSSGANAFWTSTSTRFGTAICGNLCGPTNAAHARTGTFWVWFGASTTAETATASQTVTFPNGGPATLTYWLWVTGGGTAGDSMNVQVDGTVLQLFQAGPGSEAGYTIRTLNLNAYANGAPHTIKFQYTHTATGTFSNFNVDDVHLDTTTLSSISGRVLTPGGRPITHAKIVISGGGLPSPLTFYTNRRGNYTSTDLTLGATYNVSVSQRRFTFTPSSVNVSVTGSGITTQDFTGTQNLKRDTTVRKDGKALDL